ncbi:unnamed protein product [Cyberlindnera jadinii]|uniref:Uncharacterized protein n=1 Tax=Cyberlindnera jadinii (strain ATCC 18201 / CBS 1600 / BCRC 20928 / JCM 3617 / NBRC 0987 / NRRL Y-1542) TaxID=983966 RepID=A0A0H5C1W5_CYBJN|nr:unnamed protein product [Cyberlindnera jadinii]
MVALVKLVEVRAKYGQFELCRYGHTPVLDELSLNSSVVVMTAVGDGSLSPNWTPRTIDVAGLES